MGYTLKQRLNRIYVSSKILYFIEFDKDTNELKIGFNDGSIGYFQDVPDGLINQFRMAKSKGDFFYRNLYKAGYKRQIKYI
jgi:hypothetical protein